MKAHYTVSWFSAGVSSAVATKLAIADIDEVIYTHIDDQHPDTLRFVRDCAEWFGKPITILQSPYKTVRAAIRAGGSRFINSPSGANCTRWLKRRVRKEWEAEHIDPEWDTLRYVWGMDSSEENRCERLRGSMPQQEHVFPLVEEKKAKKEAHEILRASGVKRPIPYDLGFHNNNCRVCVKGGMGYMNLCRKVYPEEFAERAKDERACGASCINGVFLDELDPERGRHEGPICDDCGIMCELQRLI
jgi:hypothetical protein